MKRKLQVFVSSTYQDLIEDRQSAVGAILKAGHIPAGMELFTSGNQSQMNTIRKWIDESDVYMLILGGRYGSIEEKSGISYTELEYDYAMQQGKALFAVVINEETLEARVKEFGTKVMEKENPKQLGMFREKVLSNISSFFDDSKDIKLCIYESLSDFSSDENLKGWVSANEITNSQQLLDEITNLRKDNEKLTGELLISENKLISSPSINSNSDESNKELVKILQSIEVKIPAHISPNNTEYTVTLFDTYIHYKNEFVLGISNQNGSTDANIFLYYNVCPKLQIYDLVIHERISGVQWSRFENTKKGNDLLVFIEKANIEEKSKSNKSLEEEQVTPASV